MEEIWKPIPGYEGFYEASTFGRIRSVDRVIPFKSRYGYFVNRPHKGRILKPKFDGKNNYLHVNLSKNGELTIALVHRLIAITFIDNPNNLPQVNHKDENKTNNNVNNLEWCTCSYNSNYGSLKGSKSGENNPRNLYREETIKAILDEYIPNDKEHSITKLSKKYGMSQTHVCAIIKGRRWGWLNASRRS